MIEHAVEASPVELRRRRWSEESKALIVADSMAPGAVILEVARRHALSPSQPSVWRKAARDRDTGRRQGGSPERSRSRRQAAN
ncbi:transposase [Bradyrhizobium sp. USDA 4369]